MAYYNEIRPHRAKGRKTPKSACDSRAKGRHIRIVTTDGELLRDFELDPTRDYQPHSVG